MIKITLLPNNEVIEVEDSSSMSLLEHLKNKGLYIKSSCGGHASCSDCTPKVISGETNLTEPTFEEMNLLGIAFISQKRD